MHDTQVYPFVNAIYQLYMFIVKAICMLCLISQRKIWTKINPNTVMSDFIQVIYKSMYMDAIIMHFNMAMFNKIKWLVVVSAIINTCFN